MPIDSISITPGGRAQVSVVNSGGISMEIQLVPDDSVQVSQSAQVSVANSGEISFVVSLVPSDSLDAVLAKILLDMEGNPILDMNGQYIIGG